MEIKEPNYPFWYINELEKIFLKKVNLNISKMFLKIAGKKLWYDWVLKTQITNRNEVCIGLPFEGDNVKDLTYSVASKFKWKLSFSYIPSIPATICWKSKSGRIYKLSDEDIDENDIEFWFEDLDVLAIHRELYPNNPLPFKLKNIQFELEILRIALALELKIDLKDTNQVLIDLIETQVQNFIDKWNIKAEKDMEDKLGMGIVHNIKTSLKSNCEIIFVMDMGSSDVAIIKKIIMMLNKIEGIKKVTVS